MQLEGQFRIVRARDEVRSRPSIDGRLRYEVTVSKGRSQTKTLPTLHRYLPNLYDREDWFADRTADKIVGAP